MKLLATGVASAVIALGFNLTVTAAYTQVLPDTPLRWGGTATLGSMVGGDTRGASPGNRSVGPDLGYGYDMAPFDLPKGFTYGRANGGLAMNSKGHVFVYHRAPQGQPQLFEFDANRRFVKAFGVDIAVRPHAIRIDSEDNIWLCDQMGDTVMKLSPEGKLLMTIGVKGQRGNWDEAGGKRYLWQPLDLAFAPNGDIYIGGGHGGESPDGLAARVTHVDKNGKFINQWFGNGEGAARFEMVHSIMLAPNGDVYLADRQDKRIVVYSAAGKFIREISMNTLVCAFMVTKDGQVWMSTGRDGQIEKIDWDGKVLGSAGLGFGGGYGQFGESNYMAMAENGDIYVGDTANGRVTRLIAPKK